MTIFYTGQGDQGKSVIGKNKIVKTAPVLITLGELDELNSLIGLVRSFINEQEIKGYLLAAQENLFIIQANLAALLLAAKTRRRPQLKPPVLKKEKIDELERVIDKLEKKIKPAKKFIIPGSNKNSAWLDYLRAVARRVERQIVRLNQRRQIDKNILGYVNRLSSFFFALARYVAKIKKVKEKNPSYQ